MSVTQNKVVKFRETFSKNRMWYLFLLQAPWAPMFSSLLLRLWFFLVELYGWHVCTLCIWWDPFQRPHKYTTPNCPSMVEVDSGGSLRSLEHVASPWESNTTHLQYPSESRTVRHSNGHLSDVFFPALGRHFGRHFVFSDRKPEWSGFRRGTPVFHLNWFYIFLGFAIFIPIAIFRYDKRCHNIENK